jgi:hypothetical protein
MTKSLGKEQKMIIRGESTSGLDVTNFTNLETNTDERL